MGGGQQWDLALEALSRIVEQMCEDKVDRLPARGWQRGEVTLGLKDQEKSSAVCSC